MRVALAQILSGPDPAANLALVRERTAAAAAAGAELVVFPEATMRHFGRSLREVAEPLDGAFSRGLAAVAAEHGVLLAAGMFTPAAGGRVHNTVRVVGRGVDAHYDKIHLFDAFGFRESETVAPGTDPLVVELDGVGLGFATCYDVRFPGLFTRLADAGARLICLPASWGAGPEKVEQWRLLVRARALDCTCFVLAAGQADPAVAGHPERAAAPTGVGHSLVVSPLGEVLGELGPQPGLLVVDLDLGEVDRARTVLPVLANRRL